MRREIEAEARQKEAASHHQEVTQEKAIDQAEADALRQNQADEAEASRIERAASDVRDAAGALDATANHIANKEIS